MTHVFISYSSQHRDLTEKLAARLEAEGYPVWWDYALEAWGSYEQQIRQAIQDTGAFIVIWSEGAAKSDWVLTEAERARGKRLISLRAPDFPVDEVPSPYNLRDHILALDFDHFAPILRSIDTVWRGAVPIGIKPRWYSHRDRFGVNLFDAKQTPRPDDIRELLPSQLLQARYEIVPYVDTTGLLQDMLDWCRNTGPYAEEARTTAGRVLHGPGGLGKTRLLIELARKLREEHGWLAGFADPPRRSGDHEEEIDREQAMEQVFSGGDEPGVLQILDYAEGRQTEVTELARLARPRPREGVRPVRIVLLSRGDAWWKEFYGRKTDVQILFQRFGMSHGDTISVEPAPEGEKRLALLDETLRAYRPLLSEMASAGTFPPPCAVDAGDPRFARIASEPGFARPLALQMETLLALAGEASGNTVAQTLDNMLMLEREHWSHVIDGLSGDEARQEAMRRGISQTTLVGGTPDRRRSEDLMLGDTHFGARAPAALPLRELARLYGNGKGIGAFEPDLLGEHETAQSCDTRLIDACLAWIDGLPEAERGPRRRALLTVLQRATREEHGEQVQDAESLLEHLVPALPPEGMADLVAVIIATPGHLAEIVVRGIPNLPEELLAALKSALPKHSVALREVADAMAARQLALLRAIEPSKEEQEDHFARLAGSLSQRGITLSNLGRREDALAATDEAVAIYRRLAAARPDAFEPDLARSLSNLGVWLSNLGRREDALAATEEAVAIYRRLAAARPDAFEPDLAGSLTNLGVRLSNLGRREDALAATEEAVAIYRRLAAARPDAFEPDLARSLTNLGVLLSDLGRREDALAATEEAVAIYRRLAATRPDAFEPDLAGSLTNLGIRLSDLGRREDALAATEEAVAIYRRLAAARPDAFEPDLARSLDNLGVLLSDLGRREDALAATEEAVAIYRRLAATRPDAFEPDLAGSLTNLGIRLSDLGRREDALAATEEAVAIYRRLAAARPDAFEPDLARSLSNLGVLLFNLGRREDALAATEEAVAIYRRLAAARPDAFEPDLAGSLTNLGVRLSNLGRREDAPAATEEAVAIYRRLAAARPDAFEPDLARSLGVLGHAYLALNRKQEAEASFNEAFALLAPHHERYPSVFQGRMDWLKDGLRQAQGSEGN